MGYIDLDTELKELKKELKDRMDFMEGRIKYLEDLIASTLKKEG